MQFRSDMMELGCVAAVQDDVKVSLCELICVVLANAIAGAGDYGPYMQITMSF